MVRRLGVGVVLSWVVTAFGCGTETAASGSTDSTTDLGSPVDVVEGDGVAAPDTVGADTATLDSEASDSGDDVTPGTDTETPDAEPPDTHHEDDTSETPTATGLVSSGAGGSLTSGDGLLTIEFQPGAVAGDRTVTISPVPNPPAGAQPASAIYEFGPSGEHFAIPARLCFTLENGSPGSDTCVGFYDEPAGEWACADRELEAVNPTTWCGTTSHFTRLGILRNSATLKTELGSARIGPGGGVVTAKTGDASLSVPAGAVSEPTLFIMATRQVTPGAAALASSVIVMSPHGVLLESPVEICLSVSEPLDGDACLSYTEVAADGWVCEDECLTKKDNQVCGKTQHFTNFAILLGAASGDETCDGETWIDATGGTVKDPGGGAVLTVPAGAVKEPTAITLVKAPAPPAGAELGSAVYDLGPDGQAFAVPVELCLLSNGTKPDAKACLGYYDETKGTWQCQDECLKDEGDNYFCGTTTHFTNFAILLGAGSGDEKCSGGTWIDATGGTVKDPGGGAVLTVPAGAVKEPTSITIVKAPAPPGGAELGSAVYDLGPNGQTFAVPVELCLLSNGTKPDAKACLGYFDETKGTWQCQDACLTQVSPSFWCGETTHFTNFAILLGAASGDDTCDGGTWIDATGGTVKDPGGGAVLTVPAGAVKEPTAITLVKAPAPPGGAELGSAVYDLGPDGQTFAVPVELCLLSNGVKLDPKACLGYFDEVSSTWKCQDPCLTHEGDYICGQTDHFTNFAILLGAGSDDELCESGTWIDASGGTATDPSGGAIVTVPAGALSEPTAITITKNPAPPAGAMFGSAVYDLGPDGQTFAVPVELCLLASGVKPDAASCLGFYDEAKGEWTCEDACLKQVSPSFWCGKTSHFTNFAILLGASSGASSCDLQKTTIFAKTGGIAASGDGAAYVDVPAMALSMDTVIAVSRDTQLPSDPNALSAAYHFAPEGLSFSLPAMICILTQGSIEADSPKCLATYNPAAGWMCVDPCLQEIESGLWCGMTDHFSTYAIVATATGGICPGP